MITEIRIGSWRELKQKFVMLFNDFSYRNQWLFRGHASAEWKMETSIDRSEVDQKRNAELALVTGFQRNMRHYKREDIDAINVFQIVSYLQHYGAPTRLLDVTTSPYVAAFFALEKTKDESALYAFDYGLFQSYPVDLLQKLAPEKYEKLKRNNLDIRGKNVFEELFYENQVSNVYTTQPYHLFDRLKIQSGGFLIQGSVEMNFESNLNELFAFCNVPDCAFKFLIPPTVRLEALTDLRRMNITRESLFPGIDGFVGSLLSTFEIECFINSHRIK